MKAGDFTASTTLTPQQVAEAAFAALVAGGMADYHASTRALFVATGSVPTEAQAMEFLDAAFGQVAACLKPSHPYRAELQRFAREMGPYLARNDTAAGPAFEVIQGGKDDGDDKGGS